MVFKIPLIPFQSELYKLLSDVEDGVKFPVFDSGLSLDEILPQLKEMSEIEFATVADVSCSQSSAKVDAVRWSVSVRIELFSTYKGRKRVAEMMDTIGTVTTKFQRAFGANMAAKGYDLVEMSIGESTIGTPVTAGGVTWQNGFISLNYLLAQIEV
ncbi:MAG: hypothetical protein MJ041_02495 [Acidaminococcaceae bacterium]|nr:hypothetical protein [Acidaminococcaceae bacterium]